jgi:hypothetical protein
MRPLFGPLTETEWQEVKALPAAGAFYKFRISKIICCLIQFLPRHSALIAFEYMSSWCVKIAEEFESSYDC